jgi:hypothetical protein
MIKRVKSKKRELMSPSDAREKLIKYQIKVFGKQALKFFKGLR